VRTTRPSPGRSASPQQSSANPQVCAGAPRTARTQVVLARRLGSPGQPAPGGECRPLPDMNHAPCPSRRESKTEAPRSVGPAPRQSQGARRLRVPRATDDQLVVAPWHELGCGVEADDATRRCLPIASSVPAQQAPRRWRCRDGAATSPSTARLPLKASRSHASHQTPRFPIHEPAEASDGRTRPEQTFLSAESGTLLCWGQSEPGFSVFVKAPVCIWLLGDAAAPRSNPGPNVHGPGPGDRW
jgi:hypothetical protein